jgi:hypothetical protein
VRGLHGCACLSLTQHSPVWCWGNGFDGIFAVDATFADHTMNVGSFAGCAGARAPTATVASASSITVDAAMGAAEFGIK